MSMLSLRGKPNLLAAAILLANGGSVVGRIKHAPANKPEQVLPPSLKDLPEKPVIASAQPGFFRQKEN